MAILALEEERKLNTKKRRKDMSTQENVQIVKDFFAASGA